MKATEITITAQHAIDEMLASYGLYKKGFRTLDEHLNFCGAVKTLFGDEAFNSVISVEVQKEAMRRYPNDSKNNTHNNMKEFTATYYRADGTLTKSVIEADSYEEAKKIVSWFKDCRLVTLTYEAKAIAKAIDDFGKWCLLEIRGLKEGIELKGIYNPQNKAFDFTWRGEPAMLWIGCSGELIED